MSKVTLSRLFIYPIKSTGPVELDTVQVEPRGLAHDRRYVVTDTRGRFFTARRFPTMVRIFAAVVDGGLDVSSDGHTPLQVRTAQFPDEYDDIKVWRDTVSAQRCGAEADAWFTRYLGVGARLYYMGARSARPARGGGEVSFADAAPLLVIAEESLADLNSRLATPVDVRNFRPNLLVRGAAAFAEDEWQRLRGGEVELEALYSCTRCILTTINPDTAAVDGDRQPLQTLLGYRRGEDGEAHFGINFGARRCGSLQVGTVLEVTGPASAAQ